MWSVLTQHKKGFVHHPEVLRWKRKLKALYTRHERIVEEMQRRGFHHQSPLNARLATGADIQREYVDSPEEQFKILRGKGCGCKV